MRARPECFSFDHVTAGSAHDAQGWQVDGIYDGDSGNQVATCNDRRDGTRGLDGDAFRVGDSSYGFFLGAPPGLGAIQFVPVGRYHRGVFPGACAPASLPSGHKFWFVDFVSPNLRNLPQWQGVTGISFAIRADETLAMPTGIPSPKVQAILDVRKADGSPARFSEPTAGNQFRMEVLGTGWLPAMISIRQLWTWRSCSPAM